MKQFRKILAVLVAVVMAIGMIGCTGGKTTEAPTDAPAKIKDFNLKIGFDQEPSTLSRFKSGATLTMWATDPLHGFLVTTDASGANIEPMIAESWDYESDTKVVFHLRKDVKFHNGRGLTSKDVKWTMDYILNKENGANKYSSFAPFVESVEAPDDYTVVFNLLSPYPSLLSLLTHDVPIQCEEALETEATAPIGCGPFKFVEYNKGTSLVYTAFEDYFIEGVPTYKDLTIKFYSDNATCLTAYLSGEIDIIHWLNQVDIPTIEGTGDSYIFEAAGSQRPLRINCGKAPFDNVKVRQAIALAIDKDQIVDLVLGGHGTPTVAPISPDSPYYPKDLDYKRDVEKAKALLAEAGYPNGFECTISGPQTASEGGSVPVLAQQLAEVGITVTQRVIETATYLEEVNAGNFDLACHGGTLKPDLYNDIKFLETENSSNQKSYHFSSAKFDENIKIVATSTDTEKVKKAYHDCIEANIEEVGWIWLFIENKCVALRKFISGMRFPNGYQDYTHLVIDK